MECCARRSNFWITILIILYSLWFNQPFFIKISCTKPGKWQLLSYSSFLCVLHCRFVFCCTSLFLLFRCFPLIVDVFTSVLVGNPDLFSLNRFMTFEQRYTTVAFIYRDDNTLPAHTSKQLNLQKEFGMNGRILLLPYFAN